MAWINLAGSMAKSVSQVCTLTFEFDDVELIAERRLNVENSVWEARITAALHQGYSLIYLDG